MNFWDRKLGTNGASTNSNVAQDSSLLTSAYTDEVTLDEQALQELQEDPNVSIFEEEEEDTAEIMADANLRLEMGRLYQMVLQNDIFADTNADPRAVKNVQREIRRLVREKMETMLGIRQELVAKESIVSSPFNDMEVTVLKMLASKMSKGATEEVSQPSPMIQAPPKKDGITSISGNLRPNTTTPLRKEAKPASKSQPKVAKPADKAPLAKKEESGLKKPIDQMTSEELAAYDVEASNRHSKNKSALPPNMTPHPTTQQLEVLYTMQANNRAPAPGSALSNTLALLNNK